MQSAHRDWKTCLVELLSNYPSERPVSHLVREIPNRETHVLFGVFQLEKDIIEEFEQSKILKEKESVKFELTKKM